MSKASVLLVAETKIDRNVASVHEIGWFWQANDGIGLAQIDSLAIFIGLTVVVVAAFIGGVIAFVRLTSVS